MSPKHTRRPSAIRVRGTQYENVALNLGVIGGLFVFVGLLVGVESPDLIGAFWIVLIGFGFLAAAMVFMALRDQAFRKDRAAQRRRSH